MNVSAAEAPLIAVGLILYALLWFAVGRRTSPHRRRPRDARPVTPVGERPQDQDISGELDLAHATPEQAMAHAAPAGAPAEMERLDTTAQIPQYDTIAIADPPALEATAGPADTLHLTAPIPIAPEPVALPAVTAWTPPDPRIVLTVAWKRDNAPLVAGRYDITEEQPLPSDVAPLYKAMRRQQQYDGGTITVAVVVDGRHQPDWEWTANDEWPRQSIDAIRQARDQLQGARV